MDARADTPDEAAAIIAAAEQAGARHGTLIVVPVPARDAADAGVEAAIERAVVEAEAQGIRGKAVTPFLLARVAELTGGASLRANRALLVNNARTAALIARELAARA